MSYEHLPFLTNPRARITRALEKEIVARRRKESITDVAEDFGISRRTVRDAEIRALELKYRTVPLAGVKGIGIDEIYVFHNESDGRQYLTIVRDLDDAKPGIKPTSSWILVRLVSAEPQRELPEIKF